MQGMFYRTARMLESGMRPVYVFDGKPPELKRQNLDKRLERRDDAHADLAAAKESGDQEASLATSYFVLEIKLTRFQTG